MKLSQLDKGTSIAVNIVALVAMVKGLFGGEKEKKKKEMSVCYGLERS